MHLRCIDSYEVSDLKFRKVLPGICYATLFLLLTLDAKCAIQAAQEGIRLCLQTAIPSLFPFLIISPLLSSRISTRPTLIGSWLAKICGIPFGSESYFIIGLLGGYPVGAQILEQAYQKDILNRQDAKRMLGFCNNAGPAFILGMGAALFENTYIPLAMWGIQFFSSVYVSLLLPHRTTGSCKSVANQPLTMSSAVLLAIRSMAAICGWVIAFRILLSILKRWVLWLLPSTLQVLIAGFLELSNGCVALSDIPQESVRFILCTAFLSFGGLCVWMQTLSVSPGLRSGWFFPGRCLHLFCSLSLACIVQPAIHPSYSILQPWQRCLLLTIILTLPFICKKSIAFPLQMLYNKKN